MVSDSGLSLDKLGHSTLRSGSEGLWSGCACGSKIWYGWFGNLCTTGCEERNTVLEKFGSGDERDWKILYASEEF